MHRTAKRLVKESKVLTEELHISIAQHAHLLAECKSLTQRLSEARMESVQIQATREPQRNQHGL